MGTVWNRDLSLFTRVIDALRDEPVTLLVTVGRQNDPADLGPLPDNVVVRRYVPQAELLPHCRAVVTHGGAGTTLGALAHGLPLVVLPQGADQYANADAVVAAGAGRRLGREEATVAAIRDAVHAALHDPDLRRAAEHVQAEIRDMPQAEQTIARIEALLENASTPPSAPVVHQRTEHHDSK